MSTPPGLARTLTCTECGGSSSSWCARCPVCHRPGTLRFNGYAPHKPIDIVRPPAATPAPAPTMRPDIPLDSDESGDEISILDELAGDDTSIPHAEPIPITDAQAIIQPRLSTGLASFDRVLGAETDGATGFVVGSVVLLGGDPGAGKSTLLSQILADIARRGNRVLYATGEESIGQAALRSRRVGALDPNLLVLHDTSTAWILRCAKKYHARVLVIDSIQTLDGEGIGASGSLTAVRDGATTLSKFAKATDTTVVIIGHVTKDGQIAGPKSLEHAVDVTLLIETGEHFGGRFRYLRAFKNRFGATHETGAFEMTATGMIDTDEKQARATDRENAERAAREAAEQDDHDHDNGESAPSEAPPEAPSEAYAAEDLL